MALIIHIIKRVFVSGMIAIITINMLSYTLSITSRANIAESMLVEMDDDVSSGILISVNVEDTIDHCIDYPHHQEGVHSRCECHYYYPYDAILYAAHVGDCRG
jgi:hypothetical protein